VSVLEPSYVIKGGDGQQTGGHQLALRTSLPPQLELWFGLACPGHSPVVCVRRYLVARIT